MLIDSTVPDLAEVQSLRLFAVIVLYKVPPEKSVTLQTLLTAREAVAGDKVQLGILLYDNTPGGQSSGSLPDGVDYEAAPENRGLADAYNCALKRAFTQGFDWLLTLDQDTALPPGFLDALISVLHRVAAVPHIAAVVPQIVGDGKLLSPGYFLWGALPRRFHQGVTGIPSCDVYAFNSASTLRVSFIRDIGGYHPLFWLDISDAYMYRQIHLRGGQIYIAGDIQVDHEFAMANLKQRVSIARYQNIVEAGCAFWDMELNGLAGIYFTAGLIYRLCKHWKRGDDPAIRKITWEMLWKRITQSRSRRIHNWQQREQARVLRLFSDGELSTGIVRPKISVCMAAHNGERYITTQLRSILPQISDNDEIIIVDDASTDQTRDRIRFLNDARIRLIESRTREGVLLTFEKAISQASGSIICLCDQDDEWHPDKISTILNAFQLHPEINVAVSDAVLVDENGTVLADSYYGQRGQFNDSFWVNLIRCRYLGCTIAFRAGLLRKVLPFPRSRQILHDIWIGTVNKLSGGRTLYIAKPLVSYRRHDKTVTGTRKLSLIRQIKLRLHLLYFAASFWLRHHVGF